MLMMMTTADYLSSTGDTHGRTPTAEEMPTLKAMEAKRVELTNTLVSFHAKDAAKAAALAGVVQQLKQEIVKLRMKQGGVGLGGDVRQLRHHFGQCVPHGSAPYTPPPARRMMRAAWSEWFVGI